MRLWEVNILLMQVKDKKMDIEALPHAEYPGSSAMFKGYPISKMLNVWFTHELSTLLEVCRGEG